MKFLRVVLVVGLVFGFTHFVRQNVQSAASISPIENQAYRAIEPSLKAVALLPDKITLVAGHKRVVIKPAELGIATAPNLSLNVDYDELSGALNSHGIDSKRSGLILLTAISRGASEVKLVAKPPATKPVPVPAAAAPMPIVPDYVAPVAPVGHVAHTYTYCVAARGVDPSFLPELQTKLASVYSDTRGWSVGGVNTFIPASAGCNLTVWLTAADQMSSFGAICDSMWSCTVYPNVILNFDRWRFASPAWTGGGGNLDDYRTMVINHETGHWLGFGHRFCAGPGQLAPVMQQQSISLQGCAFNPWPLEYEKAAL